MGLCGGERVEENDRVDGIRAIDPLLQLITLFGQTALMESRSVRVAASILKAHSCKNLFWLIIGGTHLK